MVVVVVCPKLGKLKDGNRLGCVGADVGLLVVVVVCCPKFGKLKDGNSGALVVGVVGLELTPNIGGKLNGRLLLLLFPLLLLLFPLLLLMLLGRLPGKIPRFGRFTETPGFVFGFPVPDVTKP